MPSSKNIERGRYPRQLHMLRFNRNLLGHSEMTELELMLHSNLSLPPSKVMTPKSRWQQEELQPMHNSAPPVLLSWMLMNDSQMQNLALKGQNLMNQHMLGLQGGKRRISYYRKDLPRPSSLLTLTPLTSKLQSGAWLPLVPGLGVEKHHFRKSSQPWCSSQQTTLHHPWWPQGREVWRHRGLFWSSWTYQVHQEWRRLVHCLNRTIRATVFAFPHRLQELTSYGEYILNLFAVTHPTVHGRVIAFDKAVWKHVGSVRNLELSEYEKFADLKIAHMDLIRISVAMKSEAGPKGKQSKNCKKSEPCNKWNDGKCSQEEEDCRRQHVCNKCERAGHRGKECCKPAWAGSSSKKA